MNELALFAGAGGGLLATKWLLGWRTVCYVENAKYPVEVIKARIRDGLLDDAPIWDDAKTFNGKPWRGCVDIVTAGFPCQPFSLAGKQRGKDDDRNLWPDTIRIIREVKPRYALLENVSGLLAGSHGYFGTILRELAKSGYDARWRVLSAAEVGAPHKRDRVWIVAHSQQSSNRCQNVSNQAEWTNTPRSTSRTSRPSDGGREKDVAYATSSEPRIKDKECRWQNTGSGSRDSRGDTTEGRQKEDMGNTHQSSKNTLAATGRSWDTVGKSDWWQVEPDVGRVAHGVAHRVDRLKALGNGQVPAVVRVVWELLTEL